MTVEVEIHQKPQEIARRIAEQAVRQKTSDVQKDLESFRTRMVNQAN